MITVDEALLAVGRHARAIAASRQPLGDALGCVLADDIAADLDSPPFDKALVDGFAVRISDLDGPDRWLRVAELILAGGTPSRPLGDREAAAITTGAPVPLGATAVVMHERTISELDRVRIDEPAIRPGQNILERGREMRAGAVVAARGRALTPALIGVLASVGCRTVPVRRPRVAILPTGDELVEPGVVPGPGQIRNSNAWMLAALATEAGASAVALPVAPDAPAALKQALAAGLEADLLIVTGGVSAGQRDLVPAALEAIGVRRVFHKVRLKPGKPLWFGVGPARPDRPQALVFGLPGNPVSALVAFLIFVREALVRMKGDESPGRIPRQGCLCTGFAHRGDRPTYHPARWHEATGDIPCFPTIETLDWAGSADLLTVARADGFAIFPAGDRDYAPGEIVGFLPMR